MAPGAGGYQQADATSSHCDHDEDHLQPFNAGRSLSLHLSLMIDFADGNWKPRQFLYDDHVEFGVGSRRQHKSRLPCAVGHRACHY